MITINDVKNEYVLDLNKSFETKYILNVKSYDNGIFLSWSVSFMNGSGFSYYSTSKEELVITIHDLEKFFNKAVLILGNSRKESILLTIIPNEEAIKEKTYTFKLGKVETTPNALRINVNSKVNSINHPWFVEYDGKPYNFDISSLKTKLNIICNEDINSEFTFIIIIAQDKSNNKIKMTILHKSDGTMEIIKTD